MLMLLCNLYGTYILDNKNLKYIYIFIYLYIEGII